MKTNQIRIISYLCSFIGTVAWAFYLWDRFSAGKDETQLLMHGSIMLILATALWHIANEFDALKKKLDQPK